MKSYWKYIIFILILIAVFEILNIVGLLRVVTGFLEKGLNPIQSSLYQKGRDARSSARTLTTSKQKLVLELQALNKKIEQMLLEKASCDILVTENSELKKMLQFKEENKYSVQLGRVVTRSSDLSDKFVVIDIGAREAVRIGYAVVAGEGNVVGKVVRVDEHVAVVRLLADRNSSIAVSLAAELETQGLVQGKRGITLEMDFIPQDIVLQPNMLVRTSGLEDHIPAGLIVGTVSNVEESGSALFQKAIVKPILDFDALNIVGVVIFPGEGN
jgi:rod shape-determining protein MreC